MKFWLILGGFYAAFLAASVAAPPAALEGRAGLTSGATLLLLLAVFAILAATFIACLAVSKLVFPTFWWMGQVLGQDIYEYEGVYFVGLRLSRVPTRLQRLLFGADERYRWWDMLFGIMFMVLLVPHILAAVTSYQYADSALPRTIVFPETLHGATLSALPVMQEWRVAWSTSPVLAARIEQERGHLERQGGKTDTEAFRLAQLTLLSAFHMRHTVTDPFAFSPSDRVYFNRAQGGQALAVLRRLAESASGGGDFRRDARVLVGFFHLSDYNFKGAVPEFQAALDLAAKGAPGTIPRPLIALLLAHGHALTSDLEAARRVLEAQVADESQPPPLQALAFEHLADVLRLQGNAAPAHQFLDKAIAIYRKEKDAMGIARIYLYRAALYVDQGQLGAASQEISRASSQVSEVDDMFTLNMVERILHLLPSVG